MPDHHLSDEELRAEIRNARKQSRQLGKLLADDKTDLARLADVDRQLHAERDRKHGQMAKATGGHLAALKLIVSILDGDIARVRERIHAKRELRQKHRAGLRKAAHRLNVLKRRRKKRHSHGGGDVHRDGPDVSVYQGSVNFAAVATACDFAFAKATEGRTYVDPTWSSARRQAMQDTSLACGAYHFARPDLNSAEDEARHFVAALKAAGAKIIGFDEWRQGEPGFLGALDFEHAPYSASWAAEWGDVFHDEAGVRALIYGGGYSLNPALSALDEFSGVWIAGYPNYVWSGPDALIVLHQFTSSGSVPGVGGPCDVSHYLGG